MHCYICTMYELGWAGVLGGPGALARLDAHHSGMSSPARSIFRNLVPESFS